MLRYFGRRLLLFIPTLLIISLFAFGLSRLTPGDPVECGSQEMLELSMTSGASRAAMKARYLEEARRKGLDKPLFYGTISSVAYPDTLYRIYDRFERETLSKLIAQYGNWPQIEAYALQLGAWEAKLFNISKDQSRDQQIKLHRDFRQLRLCYRPERIEHFFTKMHTIMETDSLLRVELLPVWQKVRLAHRNIIEQASPKLLLLPTIHWYGLDNQYHNWLFNFLVGDFGISCRNGQPVADRLRPALWWTLIMSIPSIFLAYLIAVPIGIYAAVKPNSWFDRISTVLLFILYSLPSFWIGTMLIIFITTKEYGVWLDLFPTGGLGNLSTDISLWDRFWDRSYHLILPIFCITYAGLAFIARQMRTGALQVMGQDFIRTAYAKGLEPRQVIWRHVFRNALFPLITMIAIILPGVIGGSLIIEVIFNIPGMGRETIEAIRARDWPVVYTVLMLAAVLTLLGNLIADFLYTLADPRVSYD